MPHCSPTYRTDQTDIIFHRSIHLGDDILTLQWTKLEFDEDEDGSKSFGRRGWERCDEVTGRPPLQIQKEEVLPAE